MRLLVFIYALVLALACGCGNPQLQNNVPDDQRCKPKIDESKITTVKVGKGVTVFDSGNNSELLNCLPSMWPHTSPRLPVMAVILEDLRPGDIIVVWAEAQFTNDMDLVAGITNVMVAADIRLVQTLTYLDGIPLTEATGGNISNDRHHWPLGKFAVYEVQADIKQAYLTYFAWSADDRIAGAYLEVDQDYGRMQGYVVRGEK